LALFCPVWLNVLRKKLCVKFYNKYITFGLQDKIVLHKLLVEYQL